MVDKVEVRLLVHPNDYAIATNAAQLLKTTVEDFCLMAMVRRASQEVRIAKRQFGIDADIEPDANDLPNYLVKLLQSTLPDQDLSAGTADLHRPPIVTGSRK